MVEAIRYWMVASGLVDIVRIKGQKDARHRPTEFGRLVMRFDPYFEDEGTLWLLHCHLATNMEQATTWSWFFNHLAAKHFTQDFFLSHLEAFVNTRAKRKVATGSLERDFRCFVRTYARSTERSDQAYTEDSFDSPLSALNLIEHLPKTKTYRLLSPQPDAIPDAIVAYLLLRMTTLSPLTMGRQISFRDALYAENSPGRVLNLDPDSLYVKFTKISDSRKPAVSFTPTAGINTLTVKATDLDSLLISYYESRGGAE